MVMMGNGSRAPFGTNWAFDTDELNLSCADLSRGLYLCIVGSLDAGALLR